MSNSELLVTLENPSPQWPVRLKVKSSSVYELTNYFKLCLACTHNLKA